jgi:hypothetical protein
MIQKHPYSINGISYTGKNVTDGACMTSVGTQNPSLTFIDCESGDHAVEELKKGICRRHKKGQGTRRTSCKRIIFNFRQPGRQAQTLNLDLQTLLGHFLKYSSQVCFRAGKVCSYARAWYEYSLD